MGDAAKRTLISATLLVLLSLAVLIVNIDAVAADPTRWLLAAGLAALAGVVVVDVLWWVNLRHGAPLTVLQAVLEALVIGVIFGAAQVAAATLLDLDLQRGVVITFTSVIISTLTIGVLAILIGQTWQAEKAALREVLQEGQILGSARAEAAEIVRGMQVALASDIDAALSPVRVAIEARLREQERALATEDWPIVAAELREAAKSTVRPLSRDLWASSPVAIGGPSLRRILRTIVSEQPFQPLVLVLIYWSASFAGTVTMLGWARGVIALSIGTALIAFVLGGANVLMRRLPEHHLAIFLGATLLLQMTGLLSFVIRAAWSPIPFTWIEFLLGCIGGVILIFVTSGFGSVRTYREDMARVFRAGIDDELRVSVATSQQVAQLARELARILHGSVQTRLVACAAAIDRATQTHDIAAFNSAVHEARDALMPPSWSIELASTVRECLERTCALWSGLCEVKVSIDPDVAERRGLLARDVGRVVEEALNNAISHGDASLIDVLVAPSGVDVLVIAKDNGIGPGGGPQGLGSALFSSLCRTWQLEPGLQGSTLHAIVVDAGIVA